MSLTTTGWTYSHGGFPKALKQSQIALGKAPLGKNEVLIRVKAVALNPIDVQMMSLPLLAYLPSFLLRPNKGVGCDFAGIVEQAGDASPHKVGDEVLGVIWPFPEGTLQGMIRIDTSKTKTIVPTPRDWTWEQAAALPLVWLTAQTTIHKVEQVVKGNITVAVLGGSSGAGMYAVYQAKQRGWTVIASCSPEKADFVRGMGADDIIDYHSTSVPERLKQIKPDAIIDCVGGTECLGIAKRYVTIVGDKTNRAAIGGSGIYLFNPQMVLRSLRGLLGLGESYVCIDFAYERDWLEELPSLPQEKIVIDSTFSFSEVEQAFTRLNTGRTKGKVIVNVS